jgi:glycerol-3-phosphate acyltransferase PlsY
VAAGLAAAVGHAWSPFLNFKGGRSLSCIFGTLLIVFPLGALFLVFWLALGLVLKTNLATTIALLLLPFLSIALDNPAAVTWGTVAMIILTAVKRIEANRMPLPADEDRRRVLWRRLLLDRDIADHKAWQKRRPNLSTEEETGD